MSDFQEFDTDSEKVVNNFAKNVRILRKLSNQSQADVAEIVKKGHTTIGNWESGSNEPNIDELILLSRHFRVTLNDLILADMSPDSGQKVEEADPRYATQCAACQMKEEVITALRGQIAALEKVVVHTEARLDERTSARPVTNIKR